MRKEEDEILEEIAEEEKNEKAKDSRSRLTLRYVRYLLLLIMVMVSLIFLFANRDQITTDNFRRLMAKINMTFSASVEDNGEVLFETANKGQTVVFKDGFAHATVEKLVVTDRAGSEFQSSRLGYRNPILMANDRYVMAYDSGGTGVMIADSFSVLFEATMDNNIITADMAADGSLVVVTEGDGYLSKIYVYNSSFKEVYNYKSLNRYVLDAALSPKGDALAVACMNIDGAEIVSEILYFKLSEESMQWNTTFGEDPCVDLTIKGNGNICGLFEWGMVSLDDDGKEQGRFDMQNQSLQCYSMKDSICNVFVLSAAENGDGTVYVCDENGAEMYQISLDFYAVKIDYVQGNVAVLGNQASRVFDSEGKALWSDVPERAVDIMLMGKSTVVVVSDMKCVYNKID
ncbi:MAG: hypothetical protein IJC46_07290 [Clostridia bacterium]|nr:hypothetical protein [Clostridia bacterium]